MQYSHSEFTNIWNAIGENPVTADTYWIPKNRSYSRDDFNYCEVELLIEIIFQFLTVHIRCACTLALVSLIAVNFTDKLGIHCLTCLRNISSATCKLLDNGTISCVKCKENLKDDLLCSNCATGFDNNGTTLQGSCDACMCDIGASQLKDPCYQGNHKCFICRSNGASLDCKGCSGNDRDVNSIVKNCVMMEKDKVEAKKSSKFSYSMFLHNFVQ